MVGLCRVGLGEGHMILHNTGFVGGAESVCFSQQLFRSNSLVESAALRSTECQSSFFCCMVCIRFQFNL